jgi:hypothetical protein
MPDNSQHKHTYLYANLPQISVVNGGHEESLRDVIEVSRISHHRPLGTPAVVFGE